MTNKNKTSNTSWPYHLYTGSDPRKQGSYVKCKNNPCLIHGGTDIMATSPEDAYEKANADNSWGFNTKTVSNDANEHVSMIDNAKSGNENDAHDASIMPSYTQQYDEHGRRLYGTGEHLFAFPEHSDDNTNDYIYDENTPGFIEARNQYLTEHGLNVYDSPLYHKINNNVSTYELSTQLFPDCMNSGVGRAYHDYMMRRGHKALDKASVKQQEAVGDYMNEGFTPMNMILRGQTAGKNITLDEESQHAYSNEIIEMRRIMRDKHAIMPVNSVLFRTRYCKEHEDNARGVEELTYYKAVADSLANNNDDENADITVNNAGFISTAMGGEYYSRNTHDVKPDADGDASNCDYIIMTPAGTRGLPNAFGWEREYIIDGGYDLKIKGIYETSELCYQMKSGRGQFFFKTAPIIALEIIPNDKQ